MKNYVQLGMILRATSPYDRLSGQGALVGAGLFGVAMIDVLSGIVGDFQLEGVFDITKAAGAWTEGAPVYWDNSAKVATQTAAASLVRIGLGILNDSDAMAQSGDATGRVRLDNISALANIAGVAPGYKVARGQMTTASASDTVVTGLATVVAAIANLEDAPVIGADRANAAIGDQAGTPAAGSILIKSYK